jgi:hypothetical protein
MSNRVIAVGQIPLFILRSYASSIDCGDVKIINKLIITPEVAHLADYAVKFVVKHKKNKSYHFYIAHFKNAEVGGMYLTRVTEISPD